MDLHSFWVLPELGQYEYKFGGNIYFLFSQGLVLARPELAYPGDLVFLPELEEAVTLIKKSLAQDIDVLYPACTPVTKRAPAPDSDSVW